MTGRFTPTYDGDTAQVVLNGLPTGVAGGAGLIPVPGLELVFDRADGRLATAVVDTEEPGSPMVLREAVAATLTGLFGPEAPDAVRAAATRRGIQRALSPDARLSAIWSRLARLDAARSTSPVPPTSPLWAAEAAQLAEQGSLHSRARAEARRAATGLAEILSRSPLPAVLSAAALAVADLAEPDEPYAVKRLRSSAGKVPARPLGQWLAEQARAPERFGALKRQGLGPDQGHIPGLQWSLDPGLVPEGVILPGLSPLSDLSVYSGDAQDRVVVEAVLAPGADRHALSRCRARLVDPAARRVLALASFLGEGFRVRADLLLPFPMDELKGAWVEVVGDEHRPVQSEQLRWARRALRWADAALRAEHQPRGLAPQLLGQDWAALAVTAWERCRCDWADTGDANRAYLAVKRLAILDPSTRAPQAPSPWAAKLDDRPPLQEPAFLAETVGR
jgi:hypothetical protein